MPEYGPEKASNSLQCCDIMQIYIMKESRACHSVNAYVMLVIMTYSCQVMCRNDLHTCTALYGFLNLSCFCRMCFGLSADMEHNLTELQQQQFNGEYFIDILFSHVVIKLF